MPGSAETRLALAGRVVTMDAHDTVLERGVVYITDGAIRAVLPRGAPAPAEFAAVPPVATGGTLYPGLIELHNHLAFNALRLWHVPRVFTNRDQWSAPSVPDYRKLISGPMTVLGKSDAVAALVRYVEAKCLLGGTTTSQGIRLNSNAGIPSYFRGVVRNVETPGSGLAPAGARIADIDAGDAARFRARLAHETCYLLHLAEGTDARAREHFLALHDAATDQWAILPALAGIHCAALTADDLGRLASLGGAMVWSPLSNLLLYGATANLPAATAATPRLRIGLGSDWSPSGSKNLLGELKIAKLYSDEHARTHGAPLLSDVELVGLATRNAASILGWDGQLGVLAAGARADLIVLGATGGDPYAALLRAGEGDLRAVLIDGVARVGTPSLLTLLGATATEPIRVGGRQRALNLADPTTHPAVGALTVAAARAKLVDALAHLPELAHAQEHPAAASPRMALAARPDDGLELVLDELGDTGFEQRPRLHFEGHRTGFGSLAAVPAAAPPLSQVLMPLTLDPLTVADDPGWLDAIEAQHNLPAYVTGGGLRGLYPS